MRRLFFLISICTLHFCSCSDSAEKNNADTSNSSGTEENLQNKDTSQSLTNSVDADEGVQEKEKNQAVSNSNRSENAIEEKEKTPAAKSADPEKVMQKKENKPASASSEIEQLREKRENTVKKDVGRLMPTLDTVKRKSKMIQKQSISDQNSLDSIRSKKEKRKFSNDNNMLIKNSLPQK